MDESTIGQHRRRPLAETVADEIARIIVEGELRPGDKLNEVEIAKRLGVSRGPVREATKQLQEAGLLQSEPFRGSFVRLLSQREVAEIYVLRLLLETTAVAEAARVATTERISLIERAVRDTETAALANAKSRMIEADFAFHRAICEASGNARITNTFAKLATELRLVQHLMNLSAKRMRADAGAHAEILADIRSRNAERAVRSLHRHISDERDEVLQYLGPHGDSTGERLTSQSMEAEEDATPPLFAGKIDVRGARPSDFDLLARMNRELIEDEAHRNPLQVPQLKKRFAQFVNQEGWTVDLFMFEKEIVGYAVHRREPDVAEPSGEHVHLRQFYIARHRRRGGLGRAALNSLIAARFKPGERIYLDVIENNPGGKVFWSRSGFVPYGTIMEHLVTEDELRRQAP